MINLKRSGTFTLLITLLLGGCTGEENKMLFQAENYCLFSAMEGTLTFQGKPAAGAKVVRQIEVDKKEEPDVVIADEAGRFAFDTINRKIRQRLGEVVVGQEIFVHYQGKEYGIWHLSKVDRTSEYEEFGGRLVNVRCEITDELSYEVEIKKGFLVTSCVWDSIDEGVLK